MKDTNIFDFEQQLMDCWKVVDDLKTVYNNEEAYRDEDTMMNALLGLQTLYQMKFEALFKEFEVLAGDYWKHKHKHLTQGVFRED